MIRPVIHAFSKVPEVTLIFWLIKIAATTLGETAGDAVSMQWVFDKRAVFGEHASHLSLVSSGAAAIVNMELIKPGASCPEIYRKFLQKFGELGFDPISFVAHGIGLHLHEEPYMQAPRNICGICSK